VKAPEIRAFDKHLPRDVQIVTCHSLHGPQVDPKGQPLVPNRIFTKIYNIPGDNTSPRVGGSIPQSKKDPVAFAIGYGGALLARA
jgi:hypothetical protein